MKNLFPAVLMLLSTCVFADEMQFITVLSTPVGSFNRLEAVDPSAPAQGATVNFCTKIGTEGRVQLKGNNNAGIENTNLSTNTTLGRSSAGDYVLQKITLNSAGELKGSRLLSNVVKVSGQGVGKSSNLYGTTLTVAGAKTKNLNVGNGKSVMAGTRSAATMVWSNEYQDDEACKSGSACAKQYLLKQKGNSSVETSHIECQDLPVWPSSCGGAFDEAGKPAWSGGYPLCSDVGGVSGGTFEGNCIILESCSVQKITGSLVMGASSSPAGGGCNNYTLNDCGDIKQLSGGEFEFFALPANADANCEKLCMSEYLREGHCVIKGHPTVANRCILYSAMYNSSCPAYILTCEVKNAELSRARLRQCKSVSD